MMGCVFVFVSSQCTCCAVLPLCTHRFAVSATCSHVVKESVFHQTSRVLTAQTLAAGG